MVLMSLKGTDLVEWWEKISDEMYLSYGLGG